MKQFTTARKTFSDMKVKQLIQDNNYHFGVRTGYTGQNGESYWFKRSYETVRDYIKLCSDSHSHDICREFYWKYESPIVLRSSENAKIQIQCDAGSLDCTWAYLSLKVISINE